MTDGDAEQPATRAAPEDRAAADGAFASIGELRAVQTQLGELRRRASEGAGFWRAVEGFVRRGAATGVLLDAEDERWSVQSLLDYWAAALERAGRPRRDASLAEFDPELAPELPDAACPYLGLNAFAEDHSAVFFGRAELVDRLVHQLAEHPLIALVGPSGCGKSSLACAGLLPRLRAGALAGSAGWRILPPMVPGAQPRAALAALRDGAGDGPLVVVLDQLEELFTLCGSEAERAGFVDDLLALAAAGHRVVVTVRSDFESFVARYPALYERYTAGRVAVTPPNAAELRQAIEAPAALVGLKFEAGVIDRLLHDLLGEPAGLPLLQFTLRRLWDERHRNRVTLACYERVGGGRQALARTADALYDAMIPQDQATARRILLLVGLAIDDRHELTRTRVPRPRFFEHGDDPGRIDRVLDRLIDARLLRQTVGQPAAAGEPAVPQIEVAHEALVRNWPRLAEWLQEAQTSLVELRRLEAKAAEWVRLGRGRSALMNDVELHEAERWQAGAAHKGLQASSDLTALIAASQQRVRAAARRQRLTVVGLSALAVLLLALLAFSVWQYRAAQDAHDREQLQQRETQRLQRQLADEQRRQVIRLEAASRCGCAVVRVVRPADAQIGPVTRLADDSEDGEGDDDAPPAPPPTTAQGDARWVEGDLLLPAGTFAIAYALGGQTYRFVVESDGIGHDQQVTLPMPTPRPGFDFVAAGACGRAGTRLEPFLLAHQDAPPVTWQAALDQGFSAHARIASSDELRCALRTGALARDAQPWRWISDDAPVTARVFRVVEQRIEHVAAKPDGLAALRISRSADPAVVAERALAMHPAPHDVAAVAEAAGGHQVELRGKPCAMLEIIRALRAAGVPASSIWVTGDAADNELEPDDAPITTAVVRTTPPATMHAAQLLAATTGCAAPRGKVVVSEDSVVIVDHVQFAPGTAQLTPASRSLLATIARTLNNAPLIALTEVQGHCFDGPKPERQSLSERRAQATRDELIRLGVAATRLIARGYGDTQPLGCSADLAAQVRAHQPVAQLRIGGAWSDWAEEQYLLGKLEETCRTIEHDNSRITFLIVKRGDPP